MGRRSVRRAPEIALALALGSAVFGAGRPALADRNDLQLLNLCNTVVGGRCAWVTEANQVTTVNLGVDPDATSRFRSLMSELGVVIAPRLQTPADTLGFAGFQFSAELGLDQISSNQPFWNGVEGVDPTNTGARRPDGWLTTMGLFVRKGMWFPTPAVEWGVGAVNVLQSGMWAVQGTLKLAIQEGFHDWPLPSAAVRIGVSQLVGTDQVTMTVTSVDLVLSKRFSLAGTARIEPFAGWNFLFIDARSGVIDGTPGCDAVVLQQATTAEAVARLPAACPIDQAGTYGDLDANFTFPKQDLITRNRVYAGVKLKLATLFVVGQVALALAGKSQDERATGNGARDASGSQQSVSLSAGFDF
jgi:hypothetical protein